MVHYQCFFGQVNTIQDDTSNILNHGLPLKKKGHNALLFESTTWITTFSYLMGKDDSWSIN